MDAQALERASEALEHCRRRAAALETGDDLDEAQAAWLDFLVAAQRVFSRLAAGASGQSQQWWSRVAAERKDDPLLSYVQQARHADEHGLAPVIRRHTPLHSIKIIMPSQPGKMQRMPDFEIRNGEITHFEQNDGNAIFEFGPERLRLKAVVNRGVSYEVPVVHRGIVGDFDTPRAVARAMLAYLDEKLTEARRLVL